MPELIFLLVVLGFGAFVVTMIVFFILFLQKRDRRAGQEKPPAPPRGPEN